MEENAYAAPMPESLRDIFSPPGREGSVPPMPGWLLDEGLDASMGYCYDAIGFFDSATSGAEAAFAPHTATFTKQEEADLRDAIKLSKQSARPPTPKPVIKSNIFWDEPHKRDGFGPVTMSDVEETLLRLKQIIYGENAIDPTGIDEAEHRIDLAAELSDNDSIPELF